MSKISVIIPVYNTEKYLERCLDSLLGQTFLDWTALCVNDGSTDNSLDILKRYAARDSRIKIITQKNGGVSSARNTALEKVEGEFIYFFDSDDFIHPQTFEIAYNTAVKNNSDIISFKKDSNLRAKLLIKQFFKLNTNNVKPGNFNKKYNISKIKSYTTNDVFSVATEKSHGVKKDFQIKHCYLWQNLYRADLIRDINFIPGIIIEDLPWWSTVMLRNPKVTIINAPLYYYIPNLNSYMASNKHLRMLDNILFGLKYTYDIYKSQATKNQMNVWLSEFMWPFAGYAYSKIKKLDANDLIAAKKLFKDAYKTKVFDNPVSKQEFELLGKIQELIGK